MNKSPNLLAVHTIESIGNDLSAMQEHGVALSPKMVLALISSHISQSYAEVRKEDKNTFYHELSFRLQSDKFKGFYPELYGSLSSLKLADKPREILNSLHKKYHDRKQLFKNLVKSKALRTLLEYTLENPLTAQLARYTQPFNFLSKAIYLSVLIPLIITIFLGFVAIRTVDLALSVVDFFVNVLAPIFVGKHDAQELNSYLSSQFAQYKKEYLVTLRDDYIAKTIWNELDHQELQSLDDEQFFELILKNELDDNGLYKEAPTQKENETAIQYQELLHDWAKDKERHVEEILARHHKKINDSIYTNGFARIKRLFMAFYKAMSEPVNVVSLLLVRPIQLVAAAFILTAAALTELVRYATFTAALVGMTAMVSVCFLTLSFLSSPLYCYDFVGYAMNKLQRCFDNDQPIEAGSERELTTNPMHELLKNKPAAQSQSKGAGGAEPPFHHQSPIVDSSKGQESEFLHEQVVSSELVQ
ncbi:MAG: hypothetical protein P4L79_08245 [Legionella sp.]|uniref:hypothetical protein n=1 Tax=Legionella sp. TaxID=459 RepID=UPI00283F5901|nr:hypothetical protein [Legionella sp.]